MKSSESRSERACRVVFGVAFLVASLSAWTQIHGLVGDTGIFPATEYFELLELQWGARTWFERVIGVPTVFWFTASADLWLTVICALSTTCACLITANVYPRVASMVGWFAYLNITNVGQIFFGYQWDALLLEALFVGAFVWGSNSKLSWLAFRVLIFKLMFLSGYVKLASNDPTWANWTALSYHYYTQPIPNILSPIVALLPMWVHQLSVVAMLMIELVLPFGFFGPKKARVVAAVGCIALQIGIAMTGTYGFFNLLTIALCLGAIPTIGKPTFDRKLIPVAFLCLLIAVPAISPKLLSPVRGFRTFNSYGLFAVMTTSRVELEVDVSEDAKTWTTVSFQFKPSADRSLRWTTLHMPRLDWQMWFEALGRCRTHGWFDRFQDRLLEGEPSVIRLLEEPPLDVAPNHVRTRRVIHTFDGLDWATQPDGRFCPQKNL